MAGWGAVKVGCTAVLLCGLLSACSGRELTASPGDPPPGSAAPTVVDDELLLTCGGSGPGFPVSALTNTANRPDDVAAALEQLAKEQPVEAPDALRDTDVADAEWFVLGGSGAELVVAVGSWDRTGAGPDGQVVWLKRASGGWRASGWGGCLRLAPVLPQGTAWVQVRASAKPHPTSTEIAVEVSEIECVSGRDPRPFLREPEVVEDDQTVTVSWTSEMTLDGANCPGNPWVKQTLRLTEPLGDRKLLDGSSWPATPITEQER